MQASEMFPNWDYAGSLERKVADVDPASDLVVDFVTEHTLTGGAHEGGFVIGVSVWPANSLVDEVTHFYPGATVDKFGMVSGGWPTEQDLTENLRPGGAAPSRRFSRWIKGLRGKP